MKVPCIICLNKIEVNDSKIIATVCPNCLRDTNIEEAGKNFTYEQLQVVLQKAKEQPDVNQFGEVI